MTFKLSFIQITHKHKLQSHPIMEDDRQSCNSSPNVRRESSSAEATPGPVGAAPLPRYRPRRRPCSLGATHGRCPGSDTRSRGLVWKLFPSGPQEVGGRLLGGLGPPGTGLVRGPGVRGALTEDRPSDCFSYLAPHYL